MALNTLTDVVEFMEASRRATSLVELDRLFWDRHTAVGARSAAYVQLGAAGQKTALGRVSRNMPKQWFEIYQRRGFVAKDIAVRQALTTNVPFTWTEAKARAEALKDHDALEVFHAADEVAIGEGFVVPAHTTDGTLAAVIYYGSVLSDDPRHRAMLQLVGFYYQVAFNRLADQGPEFIDLNLSGRQIECLKWAAVGKSDWEIGGILGIAERTVVRHMETAKSKLQVRNRTHAVAVALQKGLIPLHPW